MEGHTDHLIKHLLGVCGTRSCRGVKDQSRNQALPYPLRVYEKGSKMDIRFETLSDDEKFIIKQMYNHAGWATRHDFQSDRDFAEYLEDTPAVDLLNELLEATCPAPVVIGVYRKAPETKRVSNKRHKILKSLETKRKFVTSRWIGTGHGGQSYTGCKRVKVWTIKPKYMDDVKQLIEKEGNIR